MTKIYLWVKDEGWKEFELHSDECKAQLKENHIIIGNSAEIGNSAVIGNSAEIGNSAIIGNSAEIGDSAKIGNYAIIGDSAEIGDSAKIGNSAIIGDDAIIGNYAIIGNFAKIGNYAKIGNSAIIGDFAEIGDSAEILKTLFITGTKHSVNWWGTGIINIGCHKNTIEYWLENYYRIGKLEGYSEIEIEEYKSYILICEQLQKSVKL
jgi:acyl-[acyl carrier protein]--UDP-N-acetylglucosamine O-acyltransferase